MNTNRGVHLTRDWQQVTIPPAFLGAGAEIIETEHRAIFKALQRELGFAPVGEADFEPVRDNGGAIRAFVVRVDQRDDRDEVKLDSSGNPLKVEATLTFWSNHSEAGWVANPPTEPWPVRPPEPLWENLPETLTVLPQFVCWRYEWRKNGFTKVPYQPDGSPASPTDPATWCPYEFAQTSYLTTETNPFDGIGFVLSDKIVGFDFDHILDAGTITDPRVAGFVQRLDSYSELSPSGTGLRVLVKAKLPAVDRRVGAIEMYETARFLSLTGNRLPGTPATINRRQAQVDQIHAEVFAERAKKRAESLATAATVTVSTEPIDIDDAKLLEIARKAKNGAEFAALYAGDISNFPSHSEADLALCNKLAFWTQKDPARIDRLFRSSGLMREKWLRADYRTSTIDAAIAGYRNVFDPKAKMKAQPKLSVVSEATGKRPSLWANDPVSIADAYINPESGVKALEFGASELSRARILGF